MGKEAERIGATLGRDVGLGVRSEAGLEWAVPPERVDAEQRAAQ